MKKILLVVVILIAAGCTSVNKGTIRKIPMFTSPHTIPMNEWIGK